MTAEALTPNFSEFEIYQQKLANIVISAAKELSLPLTLSRYYNGTILTFKIAPTVQAIDLITNLKRKNIYFTDPERKSSISSRTLRRMSPESLPKNILIHQPVVCKGRVIHGQMSGLNIEFASLLPSKSIKFPYKPFGNHPINNQLAGSVIEIDLCLLNNLLKSKVPNRLDIVYTWVDDNDPNWLANRKKYKAQAPTADAEHRARFANNDELLYSLRSLFRYFNGINRVFIVTDAQVPKFLSEFGNRVTVIDHSEIMEDDATRPTFNSHVIESYLHKIKDITTQFLYLNDDVLFAKPTCPADFFGTDGNAKCFFSTKNLIPEGKVNRTTIATDAAAMNLRDLLAKRHNYAIKRKFQHTPIAVNCEIINEMERTFPEKFTEFRRNRFRSQNDLSTISSFYLHYALMKKRAHPAIIHYRYYNINAEFLPLKLFKLSIEDDFLRPNVFCINSTGDRAVNYLNRWALRTQLRLLYPSTGALIFTNTIFDLVRRIVYRNFLLVLTMTRLARRSRTNPLQK